MNAARVSCVAVLAPLLLTGCVTMVRGVTQEVRFTSDPPGAKVKLAGKEGITPCRLVLKRTGRADNISFDLAGRESYRSEIMPREADEPALLPLVIVSGLLILPGIIDLSSGALWDWPYEFHATLPAKGEGTALLDVSRKKPADYKSPKTVYQDDKSTVARRR